MIESFEHCFKRTIIALAGLLRLSISEEKAQHLLEFFKFACVGLSNTIVFYILYLLLRYVFLELGASSQLAYLLGQVLAYLLSILWSFFWNNYLVFREQRAGRHFIKSLVKTYISYSFTGIILNSFLLYIWVEVFAISDLYAPLINTVINVPINFFINKYWAFS